MEGNSRFPPNTSSLTRSFGGTNSGSSSGCCMNLSPDRALPFPSSGGFRLQPRKNIPHLASPSPALSFSSSRNRGRKRGAQTMVSTTVGGSIAFPKALYPSISPAAIDISSNEHLRSTSSRLFSTASPLQQQRGSTFNSTDSPGFVFHAMQSMSIKSPRLSLSQQTAFRDSRETSSPFIVFSPSLKACPYYTSTGTSTQRSSAGSFCSVDPSANANANANANAKAPRSILLTPTPKIPTMYGSPRRKTTHCDKNNNSELLSTPRSCSQTATDVPVSKTPATPGSVRALPSPHATPLPRSMRLTPRSRRREYSMSSDTSIFLSPPNEKFDPSTPRKEQPVLFAGLEGGTTPSSLQQQSKETPYVPSPYSCSRSSVGPKEAAGGSLRIETRSLLGPQDPISNLVLSANDRDRAASLDCDGSLSNDDESCDNFVLTNPISLAQERDAFNMPPPRPSKSRKMSFHSYSEQSIQNSNANANAYPQTASPNQNNAPVSKHGGYKALGPNGDFWTRQVIQMKPSNSNSRHGQKQRNGRLDIDPSESCSSLFGLNLTESHEYSSMGDDDNNERPQTPPTILDNSLPQPPSARSSVSSVRISRSDANNVHLTIASMAAVHQQLPSPTIMACSG